MVWAIASRILGKILLVVVGAEIGILAEIQQLSRRLARAGRLPVDDNVDPPVEHRTCGGRTTGALVRRHPCGLLSDGRHCQPCQPDRHSGKEQRKPDL